MHGDVELQFERGVDDVSDEGLHGVDFRCAATDIVLDSGVVDVTMEIAEKAVVDELSEKSREGADGRGNRLSFANVDGLVFAVGEFRTLNEDAAVGDDEDGAPVLERGVGVEPGLEFSSADEAGALMFGDAVPPLLKLPTETDGQLDGGGWKKGPGVETMAVTLSKLHGEVEVDEGNLRNGAAEDETADELLELGRGHAGGNDFRKLEVRFVGDADGAILEVPVNTDEVDLLDSFVMAILERQRDCLAVAFDVSDGALGESLCGRGDEDAVDPDGSTSLRNKLRVLAGVAGGADGDEEDLLHEFAHDGVTHGSDAGLVEAAIGAEDAVVAAVLRRNADLPEGALGVDGRAIAILTFGVGVVVGDMSEVDVANVAVFLDEGVAVVVGEDHADAFFVFFKDAEDRHGATSGVVVGEFNDAVADKRLERCLGGERARRIVDDVAGRRDCRTR